MRFKDQIKKTQRDIARYGMFFSYGLVNRLPYSMLKGLTRIFIAIGFCFTKRLQRTARESLTIAFGAEKSKAEIEKIIKDCFRNLGQGMIEMLYILDHPEIVKPHVSIDGKEHLDQALKEGRGVIAVTAHMGNFPLMLTRLAQEGYAPHVLMRPTRDKKIDDFLLERRTRMGVRTIYTVPRKLCVQNSIQALRNNEIIFMLMDQHFGNESGVLVDFFGQKAATATGPVVFATRTKSPILPIFIIRDHDDYHKIFIEPPLAFAEKKDCDETLFLNISKITKIIEGYVRRYPHEWGWMHRRWKGQSPTAPIDEAAEQSLAG